MAYQALLLTRGDGSVLLLHRDTSKKICPNQYTGIGGKVELDEYEEIERCVWRELEEETEIRREMCYDLELYGIVHDYADSDTTAVYYFYQATIGESYVKDLDLRCDDGALGWGTVDEMNELPLTIAMQSIIEKFNERDEFPVVTCI